MKYSRENPPDIARLRSEAISKAKERIPCVDCKSIKDPILCKPQSGSAQWWDDPSVYVGCADCGSYLGYLPEIYPFIWVSEDGNDPLSKRKRTQSVQQSEKPL